MRPDLTLPPDLAHPDHTGPISAHKPRYLNLLPPCNNACPAGENIQGWLDLAQAGNIEQAWHLLTEENPMPAIHGRVCYHPCEQGCNRNHTDGSVRIHAVERFLGDSANAQGWTYHSDAAPTGKRVLIVGSGPSGLSAAYHLARLGHKVEIHEAMDKAGGMMRYGIPAYRLPRDVLDQEIARIAAMGVAIRLNRRVDDLLAEKEEGGFDAVFVAIGAHISKQIDIPARDAGRILDAVGFLKEVEQSATPMLGRRVAVYGGGNTAMDVARTAKRLGAEESMVIYRRDREHMSAHDFEADEAIEEGIKINWLRSIKEIEGEQIQVEIMELDEGGRPQPTGRFETLKADTLVLALGQNIESTLLEGIEGITISKDGTVDVDTRNMTGHPGIFCGGDMVPGNRSVTIATGHGKKAAHHIDAWLRGEVWFKPTPPPLVPFDTLHLWYQTQADSKAQHELNPNERAESFNEVVAGFTETEAVYEAKRCYSCGNCFYCDGCFGSCPEDAITKLGPRQGYVIDYASCTGCGACVAQCPTHAIQLVAASELPESAHSPAETSAETLAEQGVRP